MELIDWLLDSITLLDIYNEQLVSSGQVAPPSSLHTFSTSRDEADQWGISMQGVCQSGQIHLSLSVTECYKLNIHKLSTPHWADGLC